MIRIRRRGPRGENGEASGRSRGGLSTKIHLLADTSCRPPVHGTTAGQRHDSLAFDPLISKLTVARRRRPARPRTWPDRMLAGSDGGRQGPLPPEHPRCAAPTANHLSIPEKTDQQQARAAKGSAGGRPPAFDAEADKSRNSVERTINRLTAFRAVAMRTDKREFLFRGTVDVACIKMWLRHPAQQDPGDTP